MFTGIPLRFLSQDIAYRPVLYIMSLANDLLDWWRQLPYVISWYPKEMFCPDITSLFLHANSLFGVF